MECAFTVCVFGESAVICMSGRGSIAVKVGKEFAAIKGRVPDACHACGNIYRCQAAAISVYVYT